jgi:hypothetical protein
MNIFHDYAAHLRQTANDLRAEKRLGRSIAANPYRYTRTAVNEAILPGTMRAAFVDARIAWLDFVATVFGG